MFATCLHCHGPLGANQEIESFPVGRTLAFDAAKGRLWVVCPRCKRWNLSALDERWEAVEWCERTYRDTSARVTTDQIGLARLRGGMQIVRIGSPLRPEFAAWRYGNELRGRHRRAWAQRGKRWLDDHPVTSNALELLAVSSSLVLAIGVRVALKAAQDYDGKRPVHGLRIGSDELAVTRGQLGRVMLAADDGNRWTLRIPHGKGSDVAVASGAEALGMLGRILPHINDVGGTEQQVAMAVAKIQSFGSGERMLEHMARTSGRKRLPLREALGYEQRLAIEMVSHEESERRAMDGALAALADAWREAEEIAAISDNLLMPDAVQRWIRNQRGGE